MKIEDKALAISRHVNSCSFISGISICTGNMLLVSILYRHLEFLLLLYSKSRFILWSVHLQSFLSTLAIFKNALSETNDQELIEKLLHIYNWRRLYYKSQTIHYWKSGQYRSTPRKTVFISYYKLGFFGFWSLGSFWFLFPTRWLPGNDNLMSISVATVLHRLLDEFCSFRNPWLCILYRLGTYIATHTACRISLDT